MNVVARRIMDKTSFFSFIERQERKHELVDGVVAMMTYLSSNHARICTNVIATLVTRLDRDNYDITQGDFALETGERSVRFADVMVRPFRPDTSYSTTSPLLLVEVLSPSSLHVDFRDKLEEYQALPSLRTYMICAQDHRRAWVWSRDEKNFWPKEPLIVEMADAEIDIPILGIRIAMADIYRGIAPQQA
jgi:Uma2 family endonuclease